MALIQVAKCTGDWPGASEQWALSHNTAWAPKPFWNDTTKEVYPSMHVRMHMCCERLRVTEQAFVGNATFSIPFFDAFSQMYPDMLHVWLLGIFVHVFTACIHQAQDWIYRWVDLKGEPIISKGVGWQAVLDRLQKRLAGFGSCCQYLEVGDWASRAGSRVEPSVTSKGRGDLQNVASTSCAENLTLLCALPTELAGLLDHERKIIIDHYKLPGNNRALAQIIAQDRLDDQQETAAHPHREFDPETPDSAFYNEDARRRDGSRTAHLRRFVHPTQDPMIEIQQVLLACLDAYLQLRQPSTNDKALAQLRTQIANLKHLLYGVFPNKSGQEKAWAFIKMHELDYLVWLIIEMGHADAASAEAGERSHQAHVVRDCSRTNRHVSAFAGTVMRTNDLKQVVSQVIAESARAHALTQKGVNVHGTAEAPQGVVGSADAPQAPDPDQDFWDFMKHESATDAQEDIAEEKSTSLKLHTMTWPIQYAADNHLYMNRRLTSPGGDLKRQFSLSGVAAAHYEIPLSLLGTTLAVEAPSLRLLAQQLALFLWNQRADVRKRDKPTPQELLRYLTHRVPSLSVSLWNCMEMTNTLVPDHAVRIRAYPLPSRLFHRRRRQDYIRAIPPLTSIEGHSPQDPTYCGRVVQFFSASILGLHDKQFHTQDLALVEWLCEYKAPKAELTPIEKWTGQKLCYEPHIPWLDVVPINVILGPEPVVPYSVLPTIPHHLHKFKAERFKHGQADRQDRPGSGSKMYVRQAMLRRLGRMLPSVPSHPLNDPDNVFAESSDDE